MNAFYNTNHVSLKISPDRILESNLFPVTYFLIIRSSIIFSLYDIKHSMNAVKLENLSSSFNGNNLEQIKFPTRVTFLTYNLNKSKTSLDTK